MQDGNGSLLFAQCEFNFFREEVVPGQAATQHLGTNVEPVACVICLRWFCLLFQLVLAKLLQGSHVTALTLVWLGGTSSGTRQRSCLQYLSRHPVSDRSIIYYLVNTEAFSFGRQCPSKYEILGENLIKVYCFCLLYCSAPLCVSSEAHLRHEACPGPPLSRCSHRLILQSVHSSVCS